jgi:hypothetical protein
VTRKHDDKFEMGVGSSSLCAGQLRGRLHAEKNESERGGETEPRCGAKGQHGSPNKSVSGRIRERVDSERLQKAIRSAPGCVLRATPEEYLDYGVAGNPFLAE